MPLDTHAAFRELENGGFDTQQAEVLVQVINGSMGAQATKVDVEGVKADLRELRDEFQAALEEQRDELQAAFKGQRDEFQAALKGQRDEFQAALKQQREEFKAALKQQRDDFKAALKEQSDYFKGQFVTKADLANPKEHVRAEIITASTRNILGTLLVATLLFLALKLFP